MFKSKTKTLTLLITFLFFLFYVKWLQKSYSDVVWMDQIQFINGNVKHFYNHDLTIQDFYTKPPFLSCISTLANYANCILFRYNTLYEVLVSSVLLLLIAVYFVNSQGAHFSNRAKLVFAAFCSFIVFGFHKWEVSLWGDGWGLYLVVFLTFVCINITHKYYFNKLNSPFVNKHFALLYILLASLAILEATSYFFPFLASMLVLLLINRKIFANVIDKKRWRTAFVTTVGLLIFAFLLNFFAESYSITHPYDGYEKVSVARNVGGSIQKIVTEPKYVAKFFLYANVGNLLDQESYLGSPFWRRIMPLLGLLVVSTYGYVIFLYLKRKQAKLLYPINLVLFTVFFYGTVMLGRLQFNDVYLGTSSRYSSATFSGILGLAAIFLLLNQRKNIALYKRVLLLLPLLVITFCYFIAYRSQWKIGPYRKAAYYQMGVNLKSNKNLEILQANNIQIAESARDVMIKNGLNVFKPKTKLNNFSITCESNDLSAPGFYDMESSPQGKWRWTNGKGEVYLPNLITNKDSIKVKLFCYLPHSDTPTVILNNNLYPSDFKKFDGGYEFTFPICRQNIFFKADIMNRSFIPHELNKENSDERQLGLVFSSLGFYE